MRNFSLATRSNSYDEAVKAALGGVVDNPAALLITIDGFYFLVEPGLVFEVVATPELLDLAEDLVAVGVALFPADAGVEAIH